MPACPLDFTLFDPWNNRFVLVMTSLSFTCQSDELTGGDKVFLKPDNFPVVSEAHWYE